MGFFYKCPACKHGWYIEPKTEGDREFTRVTNKIRQTRKSNQCWCGKPLPKLDPEKQKYNSVMGGLLKQAENIGRSKDFKTPYK